MFDITDSIVSAGEKAIENGEKFKRVNILDQYDRNQYQTDVLLDALTMDMDDRNVSTESVLDFMSDRLSKMFGTFYDQIPPDLKTLSTETKKFVALVSKTYGNTKWLALRTVLSEPIKIGVLTREWMLGDNVLDDVLEPSKAIMDAIIRNIDNHGRQIEAYIDSARKLGEAYYLVDPVTAVAMMKEHLSKHRVPNAPEPIAVSFLGNYKTMKTAGWWTIDTHPNKPEIPSTIKPLTIEQLSVASDALITLLHSLLVYESKLNDYNFHLPDQAEIYADEAKREWWNKANATLGKHQTAQLFSMIDPYQVIPSVAGLTPHYRAIGYKYAKAFYTRMQASHK